MEKIRENNNNCGLNVADPANLTITNGIISIFDGNVLMPDEQQILEEILQVLKPWRKGPYSIFGRYIDAEWQSNLKWNRLFGESGIFSDDFLQNKIVADIGCSNGYYMFRMLEHNPKCVVGFEPQEQAFFSFQLFQRYIQDTRIAFELLGVEYIPHFKDVFDVVFCMGIIYHRRNPLKMLQEIRGAMQAGGTLILESLVIEGSESIALFPTERYCQMKNVYFMPTAECIKSMMLRAGFRNVEIKQINKLSTNEQRKTDLGPGQSLSDWLNSDETKTIEGYAPPFQAIITGLA